jgi:DNA-directed RNA polymerase subunit omega
MNPELLKQALAKVLNPHVLINLVSRRVRQLNAGYGERSRPLLADTANLGLADIALREIIEDKLGFDMPEIVPLIRPGGRDGRKPQGWENRHPVKLQPDGRIATGKAVERHQTV